MNEHNTWEWLRDVALPNGHYSRIESPDTAPGFPDVHYQIGYGCCGTIELKCNRRNARVPFPDAEKGMHRSQLRWIRHNLEEWGIVWIIAEISDRILIINGSEAEQINGADRLALMEMAVGAVYRYEPEKAAKFLAEILNPIEE